MAFETWGGRISRISDRGGRQGRTGHVQTDSQTSGKALGRLRSRSRGKSPSRVTQGPVWAAESDICTGDPPEAAGARPPQGAAGRASGGTSAGGAAAAGRGGERLRSDVDGPRHPLGAPRSQGSQRPLLGCHPGSSGGALPPRVPHRYSADSPAAGREALPAAPGASSRGRGLGAGLRSGRMGGKVWEGFQKPGDPCPWWIRSRPSRHLPSRRGCLPSRVPFWLVLV